MAGKPFDREVWNPRERPLSTDNNFAQTFADRALREVLLRLFGTRTADYNDRLAVVPASGGAAFIADGFKVRPHAASPGDSDVIVSTGLGFYNDNASTSTVGGIVGVDDLEILKPLSLTVDEVIAVPPNGSGNPRVDIIEVLFDRRLADPTSRDILNVLTGVFGPGVVNKTLTYNQEGRSSVNGVGSINYKTGTPGATPAAPATSAGYVKIAEVRVANGAVQFDTDVIKDMRTILGAHGQARVSFELTIESVAGTPKATLSNVDAPPGFLIAAYGLNVGVAASDVFIIGGDSAWSLPVAPGFMQELVPALTSPRRPVFALAPQAASITPALAALLADPTRSGNPVKVAGGQVAGQAGQSCFRLQTEFTDLTTDAALALAPGDSATCFVEVLLRR